MGHCPKDPFCTNISLKRQEVAAIWPSYSFTYCPNAYMLMIFPEEAAVAFSLVCKKAFFWPCSGSNILSDWWSILGRLRYEEKITFLPKMLSTFLIAHNGHQHNVYTRPLVIIVDFCALTSFPLVLFCCWLCTCFSSGKLSKIVSPFVGSSCQVLATWVFLPSFVMSFWLIHS